MGFFFRSLSKKFNFKPDTTARKEKKNLKLNKVDIFLLFINKDL